MSLLGAADVRRIAADIGLRPTKQRGQNFVIDANTVRRIVRESGITAADVVVEVGPGLVLAKLVLRVVADVLAETLRLRPTARSLHAPPG